MKYMLLAVCTTASLLLLSSCKDSEDTENDPDISLDTYVCPFPQSSTVEMHSVSLKADTILGRGYDVMGNFLAATNMKRCVVNVPDSEIVRFGYLKSDANAYIGTDANSYLQNIMYDNGFSQDESSKEKQVVHRYDKRLLQESVGLRHRIFVCRKGCVLHTDYHEG
jgi:hypothetical protein